MEKKLSAQRKKSIMLGLKLINDWLKFQLEENEKQIKKMQNEES